MAPAWRWAATISPLATRVLAQIWSNLRPQDIFRCDILSQARNSVTWILDLSFGAVLGGGNARVVSGCDAAQALPPQELDCDRIQDNIKQWTSLRADRLGDELQLGEELSVHPGSKGPPHVEPQPSGDLINQDHGGPYLCIRSYSIGVSTGKAEDPAGHGILWRWLYSFAAAPESGDKAGGEQAFRDRRARTRPRAPGRSCPRQC